MVEELPVTDNSSDSEKADMRIVQAAAHEVGNLHHQMDKVKYIHMYNNSKNVHVHVDALTVKLFFEFVNYLYRCT